MAAYNLIGRSRLRLGILILGGIISSVLATSSFADAGCLTCHAGIEKIRDDSSGMMLMIKSLGSSHGDSEGCVMCHGGDPLAADKEKAHSGSPDSLKQAKGPQQFYPDPGAMDINQFTCGQASCHQGYPDRLEKALMNTEAGKGVIPSPSSAE